MLSAPLVKVIVPVMPNVIVSPGAGAGNGLAQGAGAAVGAVAHRDRVGVRAAGRKHGEREKPRGSQSLRPKVRMARPLEIMRQTASNSVIGPEIPRPAGDGR